MGSGCGSVGRCTKSHTSRGLGQLAHQEARIESLRGSEVGECDRLVRRVVGGQVARSQDDHVPDAGAAARSPQDGAVGGSREDARAGIETLGVQGRQGIRDETGRRRRPPAFASVDDVDVGGEGQPIEDGREAAPDVVGVVVGGEAGVDGEGAGVRDDARLGARRDRQWTPEDGAARWTVGARLARGYRSTRSLSLIHIYMCIRDRSHQHQFRLDKT